MYLRSDSAAGVRFLAAVKEGRGLKPSARAAGIGKATGYRGLRESFVALRGQGFSVEGGQAELGFCSQLMLEWEEQRLARPREGRHHLAVGADVEDAFWRCFLAGGRLDRATRPALPPRQPQAAPPMPPCGASSSELLRQTRNKPSTRRGNFEPGLTTPPRSTLPAPSKTRARVAPTARFRPSVTGLFLGRVLWDALAHEPGLSGGVP